MLAIGIRAGMLFILPLYSVSPCRGVYLKEIIFTFKTFRVVQESKNGGGPLASPCRGDSAPRAAVS